MKILIIRRDNIGDLICTTALFEAIRNKFPDAYLAALVNSYNAPAIAGNPFLDDVFSYTKGKHVEGESIIGAHWRRFRLMWHLRRMHFDYVLLPSNGFAPRALKLARLIRPANIIGFSDQGTNGLNVPIPHGTGTAMHETEDIFRLLAPLGIQPPIPPLTVVPDSSIVRRLRDGLPGSVTSGPGPLIALHISARKEKQRWSVERFAALAKLLHARHDARFLVFWSPGDENNPFHPGDDGKAARLMEALLPCPAAAVRTEALAELMAGLSLCDAAIMSDGGAMHVAAGLRKPIVCFFGNSPVHRWHPWGVPHVVLQKSSAVVEEITAEEAAEAFSKLALPV